MIALANIFQQVVSKFVFRAVTPQGKAMSRQYTPIYVNEETGHFHMMIKVQYTTY